MTTSPAIRREGGIMPKALRIEDCIECPYCKPWGAAARGMVNWRCNWESPFRPIKRALFGHQIGIPHWCPLPEWRPIIEYPTKETE